MDPSHFLGIPDDLTSLQPIAGRLGVSTRYLVEMSVLGHFPRVHWIEGNRWRVSGSAVAEWWDSQAALPVLRRERVDHRRLRQLLDEASEEPACP